jgi:AraC-like DNA-binding protein
MPVLRATRSSPNSRAAQLDQALPELVDVGEYWRPANHYVSCHAHRHCQLLYLAEGTVRVGVTGGSETVLVAGSVGCVPPNVSHWAQYGAELKHRLLSVAFHLSAIETRHPGWRVSECLNRLRSAHDSLQLERYFVQVIREATTSNVYQAAGLQLALDTLILEVVRTIIEGKQVSSQTAPHPAISKALDILETRFAEHWKLSQISKEVGLSQSRLAKLFNREAGHSIHQFLIKIRIRHAETLLTHSNLTVGQIASQCGFANIQHFSRVFTKITGQAPVKFRRR